VDARAINGRTLTAAIAAIVLAGLTAVGCRGRHPTGGALIDLVASVDRAERRPQPEHVRRTFTKLEGQIEPAVEVPAASRIVWSVRLPDHAVLRTAVGASPELAASKDAQAIFRIGISDERSYDALIATEVRLGSAQAWKRVSVDLSKYSGFKWSLFYRPRDKTWRIIFNTTVTGLARPVEATDRLLWAHPVIEGRR